MNCKVKFGDKLFQAKVVKENEKNVTVYVTNESGGYHCDVAKESLVFDAEEEIKKPNRYNKVGHLECWDVIIDQQMDFLEGNIIKYVWRYKEKNGVHDLKKAMQYLNKLIERTERKK